MSPTRILFVCTGNICRSPSAEGVFAKLAAQAGPAAHVEIDSCGLASFHVGEAPTGTAQKAAARRGYDLSALRARQFERADFDRFDLILAMDGGHEAQLRRLARDDQARKIALFLAAAPDCGAREVPDPYYGGPEDYEHALDLIEAGCRGWLNRLADADGAA